MLHIFSCHFAMICILDEYLQRLKDEQPERSNEIHVFDMGCGKGMNIEPI